MSYELLTAVVIFLSKYFSKAKENKKSENIAINIDGNNVDKEKKSNISYICSRTDTFIFFIFNYT